MVDENVAFGVFWPPRPPRGETPGDDALLLGNLAITSIPTGPDVVELQVNVTLTRPDDEAGRLRWNERLAFPEHSWMARVRVWDRHGKWLWPNLPYLLRAYGTERVERYGGIDPHKGVDNDFAAVLIRPLNGGSHDAARPLVSAEWYPDDETKRGVTAIVHAARSDTFRLRVATNTHERSRFGVWLIYADFLGASVPRSWPADGEWAGGILAWFEITCGQSELGEVRCDTRSLVPPMGTGFDWSGWSNTGAIRRRQSD